MSESSPIAEAPLLDAHGRTPGPTEAKALLQDCCRDFCPRLFEATRTSLDLASDLFESSSGVPDGEIESFRAKRGEWLERFEQPFNASLSKWQAGQSRAGRRPDRDASAASLSV